jgi:hypothetical protein
MRYKTARGSEQIDIKQLPWRASTPHNKAGFRRLPIRVHVGATIPQLRAHLRPTLPVAVMSDTWLVLENGFYYNHIGCYRYAPKSRQPVSWMERAEPRAHAVCHLKRACSTPRSRLARFLSPVDITTRSVGGCTFGTEIKGTPKGIAYTPLTYIRYWRIFERWPSSKHRSLQGRCSKY